MDNFKKYMVEFIGTFFLVFTVGLIALLPGNGVIAALAVGFILMVMVYAGGYISGGYYNPAVAFAATLRGALPAKLLCRYIVAEILGAIAASGLIMFLYGGLPEITVCTYGMMQVLIGEFLFTFALCYVVLAVATTEATKWNSYYGVAIGSTVTVGAFVAGGVICYGAFNPAIAIALWSLKLSCLAMTIITIIANLLGAIAASYVYKYLIED